MRLLGLALEVVADVSPLVSPTFSTDRSPLSHEDPRLVREGELVDLPDVLAELDHLDKDLGRRQRLPVLQTDAVGGGVLPLLAVTDVLPEDGAVLGVAGLGGELLDALALLAAGGDEAGPVGVAGDPGGEPGAFGGAGLGLAAAVGAEPPVGEVAPLVDGAECGAAVEAGGFFPGEPAADRAGFGVFAVRHHLVAGRAAPDRGDVDFEAFGDQPNAGDVQGGGTATPPVRRASAIARPADPDDDPHSLTPLSAAHQIDVASGKRGHGVLVGPVAVEEGCHQACMLGAEPAGAVFGTGLGEPGADLDRFAVDGDRLAGGGGAAFAVEEELEELDGLFEGAAGGCEGVGAEDEADGCEELLPTGVEVGPAGELPVQPAADLDGAEVGVGAEVGGVVAGGEVGLRRCPAWSVGGEPCWAVLCRDTATEGVGCGA